jgi:riboflavin synthase
MFTGLIREIGTVEAVERDGDGSRLRLRAGLAGDVADGDSVAVSGVCLTVSGHDGEGFEAAVMNQTLSLTTLGDLEPGDRANLEPALRAGEAMGGHLVQGHVDGTGVVLRVAEDGFARRLVIGAAPELLRYLVEHGSVALDGVSLTVASLGSGEFEVSLVPETLERTTLGAATEGARLNVEVDVVARYVERLVQGFTTTKEESGDGESR